MNLQLLTLGTAFDDIAELAGDGVEWVWMLPGEILPGRDSYRGIPIRRTQEQTGVPRLAMQVRPS